MRQTSGPGDTSAGHATVRRGPFHNAQGPVDQRTTCQRCGAEIAIERFDVVPWTRLCATCAREREEGVNEAT